MAAAPTAVFAAVDGFAGHFRAQQVVDESVGRIDVLRGAGKRHAVHPRERSFHRRAVLHGFAALHQFDGRAIPSLPHQHAFVQQAVLLRVGVVPEQLHLLLAGDAEVRHLAPSRAHGRQVLVSRAHRAGLQFANGLQVQAGGEHSGVRTHHRLAAHVRVPEVAVAWPLVVPGRQPQVRAPSHALGAPHQRQPMRAFVVEVPLGLADSAHGRVGVVDVLQAGEVQRLQQVELRPLRRTHVGGAHQVDAAAAGGLHLGDDLLVGADAGEHHLDAGFGLERGEHFRRQIIRPKEQVQAAGLAPLGCPEDAGRGGDRGGDAEALERGAACASRLDFGSLCQPFNPFAWRQPHGSKTRLP